MIFRNSIKMVILKGDMKSVILFLLIKNKNFFCEETMVTLLHIKTELVRRGKRIKDLVTALEWDYGKVSRILNGFQVAPVDFERKVRKVLDGWDREKH